MLVFRYVEVTGVVTEGGTVVLEDFGEETAFHVVEVRKAKLGTVEETVLLLGVTVEIYHELEFILTGFQVFDQVNNMSNFNDIVQTLFAKTAIKINPLTTTPKITQHHPVHIRHWYNIKLKFLSQSLCQI